MNNNQPVPVPRRESEASQFLLLKPDPKGHPSRVFEVAPKSTHHESLGDFTDDKPPIGFYPEITPDTSPKDVVSQITQLSAPYDKYELVLHVTNNTDEMVCVEVQQS